MLRAPKVWARFEGDSMKRHASKAVVVAAGLLIAVQAFPADAAGASSGDKSLPALRALWKDYERAVAKKDAPALLRMYVSADAPVMGGFAPKSYALVTAANKQPVPRTLLTTAKEDVVGEIKLPPDQTENLDVHSDGEVGSVSFDYRAKVGHGRIIWTTVLTNDGWKIASVVYSINLPAADRAGTAG
jgi:hypothetical protein